MTEFELKHGLSQDEPGPLEPVEIAAPGVSAVEADAVKRLRDAIEGECGGTWISEKQAIAVLAHLGRPAPAPAAGDALDPNHRPDLHYILGVLDRLAKPAPKDQELTAALNGMRYVVSRTDAAIAAQRKGDA